MLSEKIQSINTSLEKLLGRVDPDSANFIRICRRNLQAVADHARELEANGVLPVPPTKTEPAARAH